MRPDSTSDAIAKKVAPPCDSAPGVIPIPPSYRCPVQIEIIRLLVNKTSRWGEWMIHIPDTN